MDRLGFERWDGGGYVVYNRNCRIGYVRKGTNHWVGWNGDMVVNDKTRTSAATRLLEILMPKIPEGKMLQTYEVHYIGRTKERKPGNWSALGWVNNSWCLLFPESVLREWFGMQDPANEKNLYAVLSTKPDATPEEIKSAYRRMAMQWHPDRCREQNAQEVFIRIQEAYNILNDQVKRAKYDAGLALQESCQEQMQQQVQTQQSDKPLGFRSPLRCGNLLVHGNQGGKWFVVNKIEVWCDILNSHGQTLVSSWIYGEDRPQERWVHV